MRFPALFTAGVFTLAIFASARADDSRRLFDFTPVSADNPVVATIAGKIEIPLSELRAYRTGERLQAKTDTLAQKRALLDDLLSEYLFVDEAYRSGVIESPRFAKQLAATRTMILTDFMATRALLEKPPGQAGDAAAILADKLFDAAPIDVSNEAHAIIKHAAKLLDAASAASKRGPIVDAPEAAAAKLHAIINAAPEAVAVRYADKTLSIHELLSLYSGLPAPRPDVQTQDGFIALFKPLLTPEVMANEALRRGIDREAEFRQKFIQNRNALLRFHVQGGVEAQANEILHAPDLDAKVQAWFRAHAEAFATTAADGTKKIPAYADVRDRALADYSVDLCDQMRAAKARALRAAQTVVIDEAALAKL